MTYVLGDDKTFRTTGLRLAGRDAALLHALALFECASVDGDGVLTPLLVKDAANLYDLRPAKPVAALVREGVWHDPASLGDCPECLEYTPAINPGEYLIHEWWKPLLHKAGKDDPVKRDRELRRKRLNRDKVLVGKIRSRDKDLCRYCGIETADPSGGDKRSPTVRTLDHIDPWGENTLANVAVACRRCNGVKRDRTPEQAGMALLRPGTRAGSVSENPAHQPDTDLAPRGHARETGPGQVEPGRIGAGSDPAPGRVPAHSTNGHSTNGASA